MAFYADNSVVKVTGRPENKHWRAVFSIGDEPPVPGIYKCQSCGFEDVINRDCSNLPPCSNCKRPGHANKWKLIVRAEDE